MIARELSFAGITLTVATVRRSPGRFWCRTVSFTQSSRRARPTVISEMG